MKKKLRKLNFVKLLRRFAKRSLTFSETKTFTYKENGILQFNYYFKKYKLNNKLNEYEIQKILKKKIFDYNFLKNTILMIVKDKNKFYKEKSFQNQGKSHCYWEFERFLPNKKIRNGKNRYKNKNLKKLRRNR